MINQTTIAPLRAASGSGLSKPDATPAEMTQSFGDFLKNALEGVSKQEENANIMTDQYMLGKVDVSQVMIASTQAELSLQLTSQIRNKIIESYQEIMRMQM